MEDSIGDILINPDRPLKERFRALFALRNIGSEVAIKKISECFSDTSALLKHECAYCLGQMQNDMSFGILQNILTDDCEHSMVRHEAGEALGALGNPSSLSLLEEHSKDASIEVAETCELAVARIKWLQAQREGNTEPILSENPYDSVDPAPPSAEQNMVVLENTLLNTEMDLFSRYRAMFALRNIGTSEAVEVLAKGLSCPSSALFRHEVAYVFGQMQHPAAVEALKRNLQDPSENGMVRHECAEALGAIATQECMDVLREYLHDPEPVVKESCVVALDMCDYENSKEFQYAIPKVIT